MTSFSYILYTSHRVYAFIINELMTLKLTSPASSPPLTSGFLYPTDIFTWKSNKQLQLNKTKKGPLFSCPHPYVMFLLFPSQQMAPPFTQLHKPETQNSTLNPLFLLSLPPSNLSTYPVVSTSKIHTISPSLTPLLDALVQAPIYL